MFQAVKFVPARSNEAPTGCLTNVPKGKVPCPRCGKPAKSVPEKTPAHLLTEKAKTQTADLSGFYFCKTPACNVVYFRGDKVFEQKDVSVTVGCKKGAAPATVCYCFGWTKEKIAEQLERTGKTDALDDIRAKMKDPGCSCVTLNPSGSCCLGDVAAVIITAPGNYLHH